MSEFLRKVFVFVRPHRFRLGLGVGAGLVYALSNGALMMVVKLVCDAIFPTSGTPPLADQLHRLPPFLQGWLAGWFDNFRFDQQSSGLKLIIASVPVVMFVRCLFGYLNVYLMNWVAMRTIHDLRAKLFDHLQYLSASFFQHARTGDLMSRVSNDTLVLYNLIATSLAALMKDPFTIAVLVSMLVVQQPRLTAISLVVFPICLAPVVIYGRKVRKAAREAQKYAAELNDIMAESFSGQRVIKAYGLEKIVGERFVATSRRYVSQMMRAVRAMEIPGPLIEFVGSIGIAMVFVYMAYLTRAKMSSGDFFQFIGCIFMLYQPAKALSRLYGQLEQARAASARVFELLATQSTVLEPVNPLPLQAAGADVRFENIEFAYGEKQVLRAINLTVKAGQMVALVGRSGSGKTTLANLLLRFYDPQVGAVRIGDTDIRQVTTRDLRRQVAVVTQETILFNDSIRRNIELGRPGASDAEIVRAAQQAHAHEFILQKPQGYETVIGERGVSLSGGQQQRLAIARALLKNAPILILDEATSALDSESERAVQAALEDLMQGRTTICIAHRLSTIQQADLIVVLEEGRVVEIGTHEQLVRSQGIYRRLYELQMNA
jgi:subfamily B ATP-binding cassette protein MsbA